MCTPRLPTQELLGPCSSCAGKSGVLEGLVANGCARTAAHLLLKQAPLPPRHSWSMEAAQHPGRGTHYPINTLTPSASVHCLALCHAHASHGIDDRPHSPKEGKVQIRRMEETRSRQPPMNAWASSRSWKRSCSARRSAH